jgi:hypothetical protein
MARRRRTNDLIRLVAASARLVLAIWLERRARRIEWRPREGRNGRFVRRAR